MYSTTDSIFLISSVVFITNPFQRTVDINYTCKDTIFFFFKGFLGLFSANLLLYPLLQVSADSPTRHWHNHALPSTTPTANNSSFPLTNEFTIAEQYDNLGGEKAQYAAPWHWSRFHHTSCQTTTPSGKTPRDRCSAGHSFRKQFCYKKM
jgi:hypothetical protein